MSLVKCKECGAEVSSGAKACPKCGKPRTPEMGTGAQAGCLSLFIAVLCLVTCTVAVTSSRDGSAQTTRRTPRQTSPSHQKWYQGGSLHKATVTEWRDATYRNRLATCADFVTGTLLSSGYDERKIDIENQVRPAATGLEACISEAASGVGPTESVSFLAAMCFAAAEGGLLGR